MTSTSYAAVEKGRLCFKFFHNFSTGRFPAYRFTSVDELISAVKKQKGALFVDEYLGDLALQFGLSEPDLRESMESLSRALSGNLPAEWMTWGKSLSDKVQDYSILDASIYTATESAKDILSGVAEAGDAAIFTLKAAKYLVPAIIIGGLVWISYSRIRQVANA